MSTRPRRADLHELRSAIAKSALAINRSLRKPRGRSFEESHKLQKVVDHERTQPDDRDEMQKKTSVAVSKSQYSKLISMNSFDPALTAGTRSPPPRDL